MDNPETVDHVAPAIAKAACRDFEEHLPLFVNEAGQQTMLSFAGPQAAAPPANAGVTRSSVESLADRVRKALPSLPEVHVLANADQAPKALRDYISGNGGAARGAYHDGAIYLFTDHLSSMAEAEHVLATHEANHAGLDALLGSDRRRTMQALGNTNDRARANGRGGRGALRDREDAARHDP